MKRVLLLLFISLNITLTAQTFFVGESSTFFIGDSSTLFVNGNTLVKGNASELTNNGNFYSNSDGFAQGNVNLQESSVTNGNGKYFVDGDWINSATFQANTSRVTLTGSNQSISGDSISTYYELSLEGTGIKKLGIHSNSTSQLILNDRELAVDSFHFNVLNNDLNAITRTSGFISGLDSGYISRNMTNNTYLFPVGSSSNTARYRPINITNNSSAQNTIGVRFANLDASLENYNRSSKDTSICAINPDYYHQITRVSGSNAVDIEFNYDNVNDFTPQTLAHWTPLNVWQAISPVNIITNSSPIFSTLEKITWNNFNSIAFAFATEGLQISKTGNDVVCNNENNGFATAEVLGTTSNISYQWENGSTNDTIFNLSPGTYTFSVTNADGCSRTDSIIVQEPDPLVSNSENTNLLCNGDNDAFATVNVSGGNPNYSYLWSTGSNNDSITNISAGDYFITITDNKLCTVFDTVTITSPSSLSGLGSSQRPLCYGDSNGTATILAFGGTPNYSYLWNTPTGTQTTTTATNLPAGTYSVEITDTSNCTTTVNITVTNPDSLAAELSVNNEEGCGLVDGEVSVNAIGGTGALSYQWNDINTQNNSTASALTGGTYTVTISDINNCELVDSILLPVNYLVGGPEITIDSSGTTCLNSTDGSALINPTTGIPPYNYNWDTSTNTTDTSFAQNLAIGSYNVTITDSLGCFTDTLVVIVNDSTPPAILLTAISPTCFLFDDGRILSEVSEGVSPYSYSWSNNETSSNIDSLLPGMYVVEIIDSVGCSSIGSIEVTETPSIQPQITQNGELCYGDSILLTANGTANIIGYEWNTGDTIESVYVNPLTDSTYNVTITNGTCSESVNYLVEVNPLPEVTLSGDSTVCIGNTVDIFVNNTGVNYIWNTGDSLTMITVNAETALANYSVTVTDSLGCQNSNSSTPFELIVNPKPQANFTTATKGWFADEILFSDSSSSDVTNWNWSFGDNNSSTLQNPVNPYENIGEYEVILTVSNKFGCKDTVDGIVSIKEGIIIPNVFSPNSDGINDFFTIPFIGLEFELVISNRWGQEVYSTLNDRIAWDGTTLSGQQAPAGTYYYILKAVATETDYSQNGFFTLVR